MDAPEVASEKMGTPEEANVMDDRSGASGGILGGGETSIGRHIPAHRAVIALGSNVGDAVATLRAAAQAIGRIDGVVVTAISTVYHSEPAYLEDQPEFANAVMLAQVELEPLALLRALQAVEQEFGRTRTVPNGPRTLDVDIVDYEGVVSDDPELLLPHPLALERDFVVTPLLELAPDYVLANGVAVTCDGITCGWVCQEDEEEDNLHSGSGILSICATPIGNLGDITLRVVETLRRADLVLAEDTRVARKLLNHLDIHTKVERCDENTIRQRTVGIVGLLEQGSHIAYVTDAGMPGIADPGQHLVAAAREAGCTVEVLPGASAVLTALVASGITAPAFYFGGFLPRKRAQITAVLSSLATLDAALVFFESPHRTSATLAVIAEVFCEREVALTRELTKLYEEVLRAPAPALAAQIAERDAAGQALKGEVVLVIAPPPHKSAPRVHTDKYAKAKNRSVESRKTEA